MLDREHAGLTAVKDRVLDYLAVCQAADRTTAPVLCLVGPPGVGKTSLARSIAQALGRKFVRIALGGIKDEGEIRGHRRVYMGSQPGRIVQGIRDAGVSNPVILLDEIEKMTADFRGDPAAALLEVLDPEQNRAFRDHYLELPFDLSQVLFIATANDTAKLPAPLRDRMEIIRLPGYSEIEKIAIIRDHLLPTQRHMHGLAATQLEVEKAAIQLLVREYTREAGVREAERMVARLCRKALRLALELPGADLVVTAHSLPDWLGPARPSIRVAPSLPTEGVSLALSLSEAGGVLVPVEVCTTPGRGQLICTGAMGDLMRESVQAAVSLVRANAPRLGLTYEELEGLDIHVHMTGGGAKHGTSAGLPIFLAVVSALTRRPVSNDVALTGEITLRGRILPVGGLRDKAMAAVRERIDRIVVPEGNRWEFEEFAEELAGQLCVHYATSVWDLLDDVLVETGAETLPVV